MFPPQTSKGLPQNIIIQPVIFMGLYGSLSFIDGPEVGLRDEFCTLWHNALTPYSRGLQPLGYQTIIVFTQNNFFVEKRKIKKLL